MQIPSVLLRPNSSFITFIDVFFFFFTKHSLAFTKTLLHTIVSCYAHLPFLSSSFELIAAYRDKSTLCPDSRSEFRNLCQYRQHEAFTVVELFKSTGSWGVFNLPLPVLCLTYRSADGDEVCIESDAWKKNATSSAWVCECVRVEKSLPLGKCSLNRRIKCLWEKNTNAACNEESWNKKNCGIDSLTWRRPRRGWRTCEASAVGYPFRKRRHSFFKVRTFDTRQASKTLRIWSHFHLSSNTKTNYGPVRPYVHSVDIGQRRVNMRTTTSGRLKKCESSAKNHPWREVEPRRVDQVTSHSSERTSLHSPNTKCLPACGEPKLITTRRSTRRSRSAAVLIAVHASAAAPRFYGDIRNVAIAHALKFPQLIMHSWWRAFLHAD